VLEASIIYDTRGDHEAALELYRKAQEASQLASTADTAAQLCYRVAGAPSRAGAERARYLDLALRLSREAIELVPAQVAAGPARARTLARYRLQLVLTLFALGQGQEAAAERAAIPPGDFDDNCLYQLALVAAVENDLAKAGETLARAIALRPTPEKRNLLRAFARGEPDFAAALAREDWRALMTDEPLR
jgi:tetratricopeptide (TPR) repeat protein